MWPETQAAAVLRLSHDYNLKQKGQWLQGGTCPSCNKKELYANADQPWRILCGRLNHCGYSAELRDLYPDLFANWSKRHPQTPDNPNAAADAYLNEGRGLDHRKLKGHYSQENYINHQTNQSSATIRFPIADGWWERLLDPKADMPKARMKYGWKISGHWWTPPNIDLSNKKEIWITEGIFDAVALVSNGLTAVSAMSCNNYPEHGLKQLAEQCAERKQPRPTLIWAFDTGRAGEEYTQKFALRAQQQGWTCSAAQPPKSDKKHDWNDLHQQQKLSHNDIERYRYYGALLLAESPQAKALIIYHQEHQSQFAFTFNNRLYWSKIDLDKYSKAIQSMDDIPEHLSDSERQQAEKDRRDDALIASGSISEIANCHPEPLYYQSNIATDESWYYFRINFPRGQAIKNTFTGGQLASAAEFKKRLLAIAPGVIYQGSSTQLDRFLKTSIEGIKRVETIDYIGYCKERQAYIFNEIAFQNGKTYRQNQDDYFELPKNTNIKSLSHSTQIRINPEPSVQPQDWLNDLQHGWGEKGIIALTAFIGSLFAEQIRSQHKSYPFLEMVGEFGAGKSTLIMFLWKLLGRDGHEGMDPSKASASGRRRTMSQVSNLPVVLVESDRDSNPNSRSQFDWDELKPLYDGGSLGSRGIKNSGNDTHEPQFRATIVISQNTPVKGSAAIMSRICHIYFTKENQTRHSEAAARRLENHSAEDISHFTLQALSKENAIVATYSQQKMHYEDQLKNAGIKSFRVAHCHAQIMALYHAIATHLLPQLQTQHDIIFQEIRNMAAERDQTLESEHPLVMQFWDIIERIESEPTLCGEPRLNHASDRKHIIAINLTQLYQTCREKMYDLPAQRDLQDALRTSKRYKFRAANYSVHSALEKRTMRCWTFDQPKTHSEA